jgi:hypothetical protein
LGELDSLKKYNLEDLYDLERLNGMACGSNFVELQEFE